MGTEKNEGANESDSPQPGNGSVGRPPGDGEVAGKRDEKTAGKVSTMKIRQSSSLLEPRKVVPYIISHAYVVVVLD